MTMENDVIFVTAIYGNEYVFKYGGRQNRIDRYIHSLKYIANTKSTIICYCGPSDYSRLKTEFKDYSNIILVSYELENTPFHTKIRQIMKEDEKTYQEYFWQVRNPEIMYGKFFFLTKVIDEFCPKYVYWIDAGLVDNDCISFKEFDGYDKLFNTSFPSKLLNVSDEKFLTFVHTNPNNIPIQQQYVTKLYKNRYATIGGLFGGRVWIVNQIILEFNRKACRMLSDGLIASEESILSGVINEFESGIKKLEFDSFYHSYHEWFNPKLRTFSELFKLLT